MSLALWNLLRLPRYMLNGRDLVEGTDMDAWSRWFEDFPPIAVEPLAGCGPDARVSTIFLGIDHNHAALILGDKDAPKLLFETMVFGGPLDREQVRCSTYEQAERQHELMVARVRHAGDVVGTGRPS